MSSLRAVVRNSAVLFAGTAASKGLVFVSYLLLVRTLGAEGFGLYSLVFAYLAFFELLPDAGLDGLVVRESSRRRAEAGSVLGDALALRALLILIAAPVAVLGIGRVTDDPRGPWLVVLGTLTWVTSMRRASLRSLFELPYRLALRMQTPTVLTVGAEAAHLLALLAFVSFWDLPGAVAAQGAAALPFALLLALLSARQIAPRLVFDLPRLADLARAALPLVGLLFANTVLARADMLLLEMLRGSREVGIYAATVRLVEVANLLPALLMTSVYPLLVGAAPHDPARAHRLFRVSLRFLAAAVVPVILVEVFWAKPLVRVLFGPEYGAAAAVLPILAATPLLAFTDIVLNSYLLATGREKRNALLVAVAAAVNVALNLVLIPAHGAVGAAWATLLAWGVRIAVTFAPRDTRPAAVGAVRSILPATAAGALAALLVAWTGVHGAVAGVLGALVYAGALLPLRGLRADELQEILRALRRGGA